LTLPEPAPPDSKLDAQKELLAAHPRIQKLHAQLEQLLRSQNLDAQKEVLAEHLRSLTLQQVLIALWLRLRLRLLLLHLYLRLRLPL